MSRTRQVDKLPAESVNSEKKDSQRESSANAWFFIFLVIFLLVTARYYTSQDASSAERTIPIERNSTNICYEESQSAADEFWVASILATTQLLSQAGQESQTVYSAVEVEDNPQDCFVRIEILPTHEEVVQACQLPNPIACAFAQPNAYRDERKDNMRVIVGGTKSELEAMYTDAFTNPNPCRSGPGVLLHEFGHLLGLQHDYQHPIMTTGCTQLDPDAIQEMFFPDK